MWCDSHLGLNNAGTDFNVKDPDVRVHRERKTSRLWRGSHLGLNNAGIDLNTRIHVFKFTTNERPRDCGVAPISARTVLELISTSKIQMFKSTANERPHHCGVAPTTGID